MPLQSVIGPGRRMLARHLTRLGETLETFGSRLRQAVSSAVGETVANVVRETVRAVLADEVGNPTPRRQSTRPTYRPRPPWSRADNPDDGWWTDEPDHDPTEDDYEGGSPALDVESPRTSSRLPVPEQFFDFGLLAGNPFPA